jgi:hypothetical protein
MLLMSKLFDLFDREVSESETASVKPVRLPAPRRRFLFWRWCRPSGTRGRLTLHTVKPVMQGLLPDKNEFGSSIWPAMCEARACECFCMKNCYELLVNGYQDLIG